MKVPRIAGLVLGLATLAAARAQAQEKQEYKPAASLADPRLAAIRKASAIWEARQAEPRKVVDVLCVVADVPSFLEAIAAWDEGQFFPILIDEPRLVLAFARAFRPARVVRWPGKAGAIAPGETWTRAVAAVGKGWSSGSKTVAGDAVPKGLGPGTPGVVVAHPGSPALAGAVALAAGRLQPLLRWEVPGKGYAIVPRGDEAEALAVELEKVVAGVVPRYEGLGDDCDFLTLAGDYPYRYAGTKGFGAGAAAFDDLVGRAADPKRRWAFTGRLLGDPATSVYRAMCSLFLQPRSALMFNGYPEAEAGFAPYNTMRAGAARLDKALPTTLRTGATGGTLAAWHRAFDPINPFGLALINSHGNPDRFNLVGGAGGPWDVPSTGPTAVAMIHSYSAADPTDPNTVAGRWLANGAFFYFGSLNEPFLQSFRTHDLVADLIAEGLPLSVAVRLTADEARLTAAGGPTVREIEQFSLPWRLQVLGDPLYRVSAALAKSPRLARWEPITSWPADRVGPAPKAGAADAEKLSWARSAALARWSMKPEARPDLAGVLRSIRRDRLSKADRDRFDALLFDALVADGRTVEWCATYARVPASERSRELERALETVRVANLYRAIDKGSWPPAVAVWDELVRSPSHADLKAQATRLVAPLATTPARLADWRKHLRSALADDRARPSADPIQQELGRVEKALGAGRARGR
ncbi:MAG TPA: hypothetical protein VG406_02240 [Isosphaeraceae bacterium]|nr:hypothetical protein [Isosphaeraceae bacterium]